MADPRAYIQQHRAALFDWLVIFISFSLGFIFPTLTDFIKSQGFYNWMLAALLLYTTGAALKDLPLSYRTRNAAKVLPTVPYILFLVIGHWLIIFLLVVLAEPAIRHVVGLQPLTEKNAASWELMLSASVVATAITWLVYRGKSKRKSDRKYSAVFLFRMELVADIFLVAGVSVFTFVFWEKGAMTMLDRAATQTLGDIWFLFVFLAILFLFFYLPLRYLFFMEDRAKSGNRRRLFLIFGFLLIRALFEMLQI